MRLFNYFPSRPENHPPELEKKVFSYSLIFPTAFVVAFWMVKLAEESLGLSFVKGGIYPVQLKGLPGILFSPFIHSGYKHLISNSIPFFLLSLALFYFYRKLAYRIFVMIYFLSGLCVWLGGREAWHIGASGIVYGLAAFLFFSGIFRNDVKLLTISIIVVFLYGGLFWGILPIRPEVSWESHLCGFIAGVLTASGTKVKKRIYSQGLLLFYYYY